MELNGTHSRRCSGAHSHTHFSVETIVNYTINCVSSHCYIMVYMAWLHRLAMLLQQLPFHWILHRLCACVCALPSKHTTICAALQLCWSSSNDKFWFTSNYQTSSIIDSSIRGINLIKKDCWTSYKISLSSVFTALSSLIRP